MKLSSIQIDRFGARSQLQLDHLADQLNVVYGPNGSGKTTIIRFLSWMLYGQQDRAGQRYLEGGHTMGGSLAVEDGQHRHLRLTRTTEQGGREQLRVMTSTGQEALPELDRQRLTGVDIEEFDHVFSFGFDQPPALDKLIRIATARGFALTYDESQMRRLRDLETRLDDLRRQRGTYGDESTESLLARRQRLEEESREVQQRRDQRLYQIQLECDEIQGEIEARRRQLDDLKAVLQRTNDCIEQRKSQLEQQAEDAHRVRQRWSEERSQQVADVDFQLEQWHNVLDTIRRRNDALRAEHVGDPLPPALTPVTDEADLRVFLRSLGYQVDDIEADLRDLGGMDGCDESVNDHDYLRSVFGSALQTMRDDVQRLSRELQQQQRHAKHHDLRREQDALRRCETELTSLIDALNERRQSLSQMPEFADIQWSRYVSPRTSTRSLAHTEFENGDDQARPPWYGLNGKRSHSVHCSGNDHESYGVADPVLEARLNHLVRRSDYLHRRIRDLEHDVVADEHRLETLRSGRDRLDEEHRLASIRQEIESIDERLRLAEERRRRVAEIETLERQVNDLRRTMGPSDILRQAGAILTRLTDGAYRGVRIDPRYEMTVVDEHGQNRGFQELSRGTRDQVYLGLVLSLVDAYRRRGIRLPLVLNDVFVNIDDDRTHATAAVLSQFASQGHQILLFTRHELVTRRFDSLHAKIYTLRERTAAVAPPPVASVNRDRPRHDAYSLDRVPPSSSRIDWDQPHRFQPEPPAAPLPVEITQPIEPARRAAHHDWIAQWEPSPRRTVAAEGDAPARDLRTPVAETTPLAEIEWLNPQHVARLAEQGVQTVGRFLEMEPEDGEQRLAGFSVTPAMIFRWQSELSLQCYVGLSANDAALLVACGIDDPEELSYIDVSELHRRIGNYLSTSDSRSQFGSLARYERSRLSRWIQAARRSHYRRQQRRWDRFHSRPESRDEPGRRRRDAGERATRRKETKPREVKRAQRSPQPTTIPVPERDEPLRFYLETTDPVVDAPSIGPKTAERFHAIGILTVAELLAADPDDTAARIDYRRITPELIKTWQLQTEFVCRVPNLRGHDAQILVACDVPNVDALSKMTAETLYAEVKKFVRTAEGKRVLRGSNSPDLEEVTRWITWSRKSRSLDLVGRPS